jgi:hypothetical protein
MVDGAAAVVLGCSEVERLVGERESVIPVIDSTMSHATAAVEAALVAWSHPDGIAIFAECSSTRAVDEVELATQGGGPDGERLCIVG